MHRYQAPLYFKQKVGERDLHIFTGFPIPLSLSHSSIANLPITLDFNRIRLLLHTLDQKKLAATAAAQVIHHFCCPSPSSFFSRKYRV